LSAPHDFLGCEAFLTQCGGLQTALKLQKLLQKKLQNPAFATDQFDRKEHSQIPPTTMTTASAPK